MTSTPAGSTPLQPQAGNANEVGLPALAREVIAYLEQGRSREHLAPGHAHTVPGVWDMSNRPELAGTACSWCDLWSRFRHAALAASTDQEAARANSPGRGADESTVEASSQQTGLRPDAWFHQPDPAGPWSRCAPETPGAVRSVPAAGTQTEDAAAGRDQETLVPGASSDKDYQHGCYSPEHVAAVLNRPDLLAAAPEPDADANVQRGSGAAAGIPAESGAESGRSGCGCVRCLDESGKKAEMLAGMLVPLSRTYMVLCAICGNKRCPHANDHRHACTGSNEPGQPGSAYPGAYGAEQPADGAEPLPAIVQPVPAATPTSPALEQEIEQALCEAYPEAATNILEVERRAIEQRGFRKGFAAGPHAPPPGRPTGLVCPACGVDRAKLPCQRPSQCGMGASALPVHEARHVGISKI